MVFVLHRYVFRELLKILVPATVALTLIMSLLSILRPIQEYGIGPGQVVPILGYSLPITLTFVLPLSALFAVAMVYGRLASDNELEACKASGISLWTLVYPGLAMAINVIAGIAAEIPYGIGFVLMIVVLVGGHGFNLAISGLSAFVHTLRLQYVEFFPKFLVGGGRSFEPLSKQYKHIYINKNQG